MNLSKFICCPVLSSSSLELDLEVKMYVWYLIGQEPDKIKSGWLRLRLASLYALEEIGGQKLPGDDPPQVKLAYQEDFESTDKTTVYCECVMWANSIG